MKSDPLKTALMGDMTTKTDERIQFFGVSDELSAYIMELSHYIDNSEIVDFLITIVKELSHIMGIVAGSKKEFNQTNLAVLLERIIYYKTSSLNSDYFTLPGKTKISARIHIVRTVTRRAELAYAQVYAKYNGNNYIFEYLNKLSTFFYELALFYENTI